MLFDSYLLCCKLELRNVKLKKIVCLFFNLKSSGRRTMRQAEVRKQALNFKTIKDYSFTVFIFLAFAILLLAGIL